MNLIKSRLPAFKLLGFEFLQTYFGSKTLEEVLHQLLTHLPADVRWQAAFIPDGNCLSLLCGKNDFTVVHGEVTVAVCGSGSEKIPFSGVEIVYPWHLLDAGNLLAENISGNLISGALSEKATVDGTLILGENSRILPGVYIDGTCVIGKNCKIGPNCYLRGTTFIGDDCHIGQAVEIKNSIIGNHSSIGHLSYAGDSIIGNRVNFGAGTVISNLRHDGKNHRCMPNGVLIDTGRRKFGALIGCDVHTGIHTAVYPGRILSAGTQTAPGDTVKHNL